MGRSLIITADDFGLWPSYDAGIMEAVAADAIDAVSVMALRAPSVPVELREWGGAVGLHLEASADGSRRSGEEVERQLDLFERAVGRAADYLDGHHHCHAEPSLAEEVAVLALRLDLPVRSISDEHRGQLRAAGVRTPGRLIGRYEESQPTLPAELGSLSADWTEWMVHPGRADPASGSNYDAGREEDLTALLALHLPREVMRSDHRSIPLS